MINEGNSISIAVQESVHRSLEALERNMGNIDRFEALRKAAVESGDLDAAGKLERRRGQAALMVSAISEELRVTYITGPRTTAYDQRNPYGQRKKFRTDTETIYALIETTVGDTKSHEQLRDYALAARQSGRDLYLHGPLLTQEGKRRAEAYGFKVGDSYEDIFAFITSFNP